MSMPCSLNAMDQHTAHAQFVRITKRVKTALKCVGKTERAGLALLSPGAPGSRPLSRVVIIRKVSWKEGAAKTGFLVFGYAFVDLQRKR